MPKEVMGIPLSGKSAVPAEGFLKAEAGQCGLGTCCSIIGFILTLIIWHQHKTGMEKVTVPTPPSEEKAADTQLAHAFVWGLVDVSLSICLGAACFGCAWSFVKNMDPRGLRACCVLNGCGSVIMCLNALALIFLFGWYVKIYHDMDDAVAMCATNANQLWCQQTVTHLRGCMFTMCVAVFFVIFEACFLTCLCGWSAKSASETIDALDDAEYGDFDNEGE